MPSTVGEKGTVMLVWRSKRKNVRSKKMKKKLFMAIGVAAVSLLVGGMGKNVVFGAEASKAVDTSSAYAQSYSEQKETKERTAVHFYHPRKLVLQEKDAKAAFWYSSNNDVIRVSSDGMVEAMSEGVADVTAYGMDGKPIQTFALYATTAADKNPLQMTVGSVDWYDTIYLEDVQERINTITDYACWLFENDVYYNMWAEAENPQYGYAGEAYWMQMANADWMFKNKSGICCTVAAGGQYALVGDYEENGLIFMSGPYGHVISYFKENGQYMVVDFTCNISDGNNVIRGEYRGDVMSYTKNMIGTGSTLKEAFQNYMKDGRGSFYMDNYIIYAVDLTGLDYYPAEANNWSQGKNFFEGTNVLYAVEGTKIETLYVAEHVDFAIEYKKREEIPSHMEVVTEATDVRSTETSVWYGDVPELKGAEGKPEAVEKVFMPTAEMQRITALTQEELLSYVDSSSNCKEACGKQEEMKGRMAVHFFHPMQLELAAEEKAAFWYSTNANVIRVTSDGLVTAYGEGIADVVACDAEGNTLQVFQLYAATYADSNPLALTWESAGKEKYSAINYEDIKESINTITDYAKWMYDNGAFADGEREPMSPEAAYVNYGSDSLTVWMQMANSNWIFKDFSGVCCNAAAGALYSLEGDYEEYGLIFMSGPYGHVLNYYMENGEYYIFDFTAVYGGYRIRDEFAGNVEAYVQATIGRGATLADAFANYISLGGGSFYYENYMIYAMNLTGLDYYPAESNNWAWGQPEEILERVNILYVVEGTQLETLYVNEKIRFEIEYVGRNEVPANFEVVLTERVKEK